MNIRLNKEQKIQVKDSSDIYGVMQQILLRQQRIDRNREHFWTIGLSTDSSILYIELVSMGTVNSVPAEPMEVFSFALQKRAVRIILVHSHPSGNLEPSEADKDITDRLIQTGHIVKLPVLDHIIITATSFYSFAESGLLKALQASVKYVPPYLIAEQIREDKAKEMARTMKQKGYSIIEIAELTGLSPEQIRDL
ncbi:JAB domain-containing protein [Taibaiella chishuiensis]|uniref:DNA repair protein RadC n=1 Tax=Taibaiella chishuiensis TaxID=1434707 RepID=A0A2P8CPH5_9BACT|nr:JAB domain-containing protein [Taibaiella chishuiensis]PSK86878.1 DNA repair protein RadC [Taibaiella chishuiensis]